MQARICPKCKAENKLTNASCSKCYASLEGALMKDVPDVVVPTARQNAAPGPSGIESAPPSPGMPTVGGPPPTEGPPAAAAPSPYGPPPSSVYTPPSRENMRPIKQGPNVMAIILIIILIGGVGFGAWWFAMRPKSPEEMVKAFTEATKAGDLEKMKTCVASSARAYLEMPGVAEAIKKGLELAKNKGEDSTNKQYLYGPTSFEGDAIAVVKVTESTPDGAGTGEGSDVVLVKEEGKWLVDFQETARREMKKRGMKLPPGM